MIGTRNKYEKSRSLQDTIRELLDLSCSMSRVSLFRTWCEVPTTEGKMAVGNVTEGNDRVLLVKMKKQRGKYVGRYYDIRDIQYNDYQLILGARSACIEGKGIDNIVRRVNIIRRVKERFLE